MAFAHGPTVCAYDTVPYVYDTAAYVHDTAAYVHDTTMCALDTARQMCELSECLMFGPGYDLIL